MKPILDWLDSRTGYRGMSKALLYEHIPGGARWRYVWGSTLIFCFATQVITGLFLWMSYAPSSQTAWESVYYIQHELWMGWLVRGIHHFTAQAMIVLLALHMLQVIIDGAYKAPREVNFWIGLILLQIVMGLSLTGYLLPWDQKGYWATKVATSLMEAVPVVGPAVQKVVIGGHDYGHHTLTRFFALHAGILPGLMIIMIVAHIYAFRRHGITAKLAPDRPDSHFWPDQILKDGVACLGVLAAVLFLVFYFGAPLGAPADPTEQYSAARPEWYFLFLFQLLKYFPGELELIGAIVIPGIIMVIFFLMPFIGKAKVGHAFNVLFVFVLLGIAGYLTFEAVKQDSNNPEFNAAVTQAQVDGDRAVELAKGGIPEVGAKSLMRGDPKTMGPKLFAANCASCHRYNGHDGMGKKIEAPSTAADLDGFITRQWLTDFLDPKLIDSHRFFGGTKFAKGKMVKTVKEDVAEYDDDQKKQLTDLIARFTEMAAYNDADATALNDEMAEPVKTNIEAMTKLMGDEVGLSCLDCHRFYGEGTGSGPTLTGYRSVAWIKALIHDPGEVKYGMTVKEKEAALKKAKAEGKTVADPIYTMPAFGATKQLEATEIDIIARWLHGKWYGSEPEKPAAE